MKLFRSKSRKKNEQESAKASDQYEPFDIRLDLPDNRLDRSPASFFQSSVTKNEPAIKPKPKSNTPLGVPPRKSESQFVPAGNPPRVEALKAAPPRSPTVERGLVDSHESISHHLAANADLMEQSERCAVTRELVKKFVADIWNRGDVELIPEVCHHSLRFNGSVGMDRVGHKGFARMVSTIREALTDYHCEIHSMVVEGNKAFARMRFTGRHTGNLLGYAATGRAVAWMGVAEFTCKDGRILKVWELGDAKTLEEQLAIVPEA